MWLPSNIVVPILNIVYPSNFDSESNTSPDESIIKELVGKSGLANYMTYETDAKNGYRYNYKLTNLTKQEFIYITNRSSLYIDLIFSITVVVSIGFKNSHQLVNNCVNGL